MTQKTQVSIVDKAVDAALAHVAKESAVKPMGLFMGGLGYAGVGLWTINMDGLPAAPEGRGPPCAGRRLGGDGSAGQEGLTTGR